MRWTRKYNRPVIVFARSSAPRTAALDTAASHIVASHSPDKDHNDVPDDAGASAPFDRFAWVGMAHSVMHSPADRE